MSKILIKNGRVWDGEKFFLSDVLTENNKIAKIEENLSDEADFIFDAKDKIVCPGLVDLHVHFKGVSGDVFGINAEMSTIPFGVTAAADACGALGDKKLLESLAVKSKVFVCAEFKNNKAYFDSALKMLEKYEDKAVGIKVYFDTTISDVTDVTPLCQVVEFAEKHNLIVMVHSSSPPIPMPKLLDALRCGDILTHTYHGGKNNVLDDNFECIFKAKERGVVIDAGFAGHIHTDFNVFENAIRCGAVPDVISTDITRASAYKRGGRYGMTMCMSIAKTLGMTEEEVFKAVTSTPAKVLGMENEWGDLRQGRCADVTVLENADESFELTDKSGNTIKNKEGYRCILTVSDGEVLYRR